MLPWPLALPLACPRSILIQSLEYRPKVYINIVLRSILILTFGLYSKVNINIDLGRHMELNIVRTWTLVNINIDLRSILLGLGQYFDSAGF